MKRMLTRRNVIVAALVVGLGAVGGGVAVAVSGDDDASDTRSPGRRSRGPRPPPSTRSARAA